MTSRQSSLSLNIEMSVQQAHIGSTNNLKLHNMNTTSGVFGALALIITTVIIFQFGAQKVPVDHPDKPTSHVVYDHPDGR